ncbi:MAG: acyl-ACP--UDP-N-acetylglucosamine O-acyltransferase [Bacteroidales bacterium]|jgi:UDP-N-acetylglucosamine acyltransferase|nr:acyl-ACP--UDP-N-acetylglucosamine O-acyltransferase [Bacteroidales bacterium]
MSNISSLAYVHPNVEIRDDVIVDPFAYIEDNVVIGAGTRIMPHACIMSGARIGKNCTIFPNAVISGIPQDLKFEDEESLAIIGDNTTIRECVTINRGTKSRGQTVVGNNCLLMAYCHVAHDCILKDYVIVGNSVQIAGEVEVDDYAIISGGTLVHQFTRVGKHTMIQGGTRLGKDIPPYTVAGREPVSYVGLNIVGLRRRGFSREQINNIQEIYRYLYLSGYNISQALEKIESEIAESEERTDIIDFVRASSRGVVRGNMD